MSLTTVGLQQIYRTLVVVVFTCIVLVIAVIL